MKLDSKSTCGHLALVNKPDYKSRKFSYNPEVARGIEGDKNTIAQINRHKEDGVDRGLPGVNGFMDCKDSIHGTEHTASQSKSEGSNKGKDLYIRKSVVDLPELVVFYQEGNCQFVKDIFMDREVPSHDKCLVEDCKLDHNIISCMLNSYVDSTSESSEETLETVSSVSNESKFTHEHDCKKDALKQGDSKKMMMEDEKDICAGDDNLIDHSMEKIALETQCVREVSTKEAILANSTVSCATDATDDINHTSEPSFKSEAIHHSDSSITTISSREETPQGAECQQSLEVKSTSRPGEGMPESLTGLSQSVFYQHGHEESSSFAVELFSGSIGYQGSIPHSGNISLRSNSSNASSHSFAFPIISSEWNSSPVRMVKADRRQLRKHQGWRMCFLCCKF